MSKMTNLWKVLPVAAAVLALGGCGGDGGVDSTSTPTPSSGGSITACFTANSTVNFALTVSNLPSGQIAANRSTTGPMTYNGQAATGQTLFYPSGNITYTLNNYWTVTDSGVTLTATIDQSGTVVPDGSFFPQNMNPGQTTTNSTNDITTFVGFETVNLAGKAFSNVCHFNAVDHQGNQAEAWYASGYGMIKHSASGSTWQYNGDL